MIPLRDENPTTLTPVVTVSLIVLNCLVFLYQLSLGPAEERFILSYAAVPAEWFHPGTVVGDPAVPSALTVLTSMFLHAGRSEEHTSELQSLTNLVCRLLLEKK